MYEAGLSMYDLEECDRLFNIASRRLERKQESKEIGQSESTIDVQNCISAIERDIYVRMKNIICRKMLQSL